MEITLLCLLVNSAALSESVGAGNFQELFSKLISWCACAGWAGTHFSDVSQSSVAGLQQSNLNL